MIYTVQMVNMKCGYVMTTHSLEANSAKDAEERSKKIWKECGWHGEWYAFVVGAKERAVGK